jgi:hypothetical protein
MSSTSPASNPGLSAHDHAGQAPAGVDASIGQLRSSIYLRWRIRMQAVHDSTDARVVEQHAFATADTHIHSINLLCSGFHADRTQIPRKQNQP